MFCRQDQHHHGLWPGACDACWEGGGVWHPGCSLPNWPVHLPPAGRVERRVRRGKIEEGGNLKIYFFISCWKVSLRTRCLFLHRAAEKHFTGNTNSSSLFSRFLIFWTMKQFLLLRFVLIHNYKLVTVVTTLHTRPVQHQLTFCIVSADCMFLMFSYVLFSSLWKTTQSSALVADEGQ